jgi:hypothetical protein
MENRLRRGISLGKNDLEKVIRRIVEKQITLTLSTLSS